MERSEIRAVVAEAVLLGKTNTTKSEFEIEGKDFTVVRYAPMCDICVWTNNGCQSIFSSEGTQLTDEEYTDIITTRIIECLDGYIHCSHCGKKFPKIEVDGYKRSYFAGVYCQKCWDNKYKAIEAAETYD